MQSSFSGDSMGIGLHLTHELVNVHKGSIEYAENEGQGSVLQSLCHWIVLYMSQKIF